MADIKETTWIEEEAKNLTSPTNTTGEILPSLKLESGKITKFKADFSVKPSSWTSPDGVVKAIIPVTHKGEKKNLWLNKKNPLYHELIKRALTGQTEFAISTTGGQKDTRYTIVDEE